MNKILKSYLPGLSMAFTVVVLLGGCMNLSVGNTLNGFALFVIELAGYLIVAAVIDALICRIDLKRYASSFIIETVIIYPVTGLFAYYGHWFGFSVKRVILYTILYLIIMLCIHLYFYYLQKKEAESINQYLGVERKN